MRDASSIASYHISESTIAERFISVEIEVA